jgi:hypothetical protein
LLTIVGIHAPVTHDLGKIASLLPAETQLEITSAELVRVNPYAVDVRYVDDSLEPRREDALAAFELAARVRTEARRKLPPSCLAV